MLNRRRRIMIVLAFGLVVLGLVSCDSTNAYAQSAGVEKTAAPKTENKPVKSDQSRRDELTKMLEQRKSELKSNSSSVANSSSSEGSGRRSRESRGEDNQQRKENNREGSRKE